MRRTLLTFALCCGFSQAGLAQEQSHAPWLNTIGRFWGVGYSAGYHAQTSSRLGLRHYSPDHNVVPQPPRGVHAHPNLYAGGANQPMAYYPQSMTTPYQGTTPNYGPTHAPQTMSSQNLVPAPPKPVEPPPNWLKQYISPEAGDKGRADELLNDNSPNDNSPNDNSPSDRKGVMLAPSLEDSTTSLSITPAQTPAYTPARPTVQIGGRPVISVLQQ